MSQEVDSRVVEMRFDNANFEKNTKQTISTIDRLMEKLQFKGAERALRSWTQPRRTWTLPPCRRALTGWNPSSRT